MPYIDAHARLVAQAKAEEDEDLDIGQETELTMDLDNLRSPPAIASIHLSKSAMEVPLLPLLLSLSLYLCVCERVCV